jgi:translation elongation factor EF-Tu-like GTPase
MTFEFAVVDAIRIAGRSIIFTGKVDRGEVRVGDDLFLRSPHGQIKVKVISLEPSGFRVAGAKAGDNVAVVVQHVNLEPVADGLCLTSANQVQVQSLTLHGLRD